MDKEYGQCRKALIDSFYKEQELLLNRAKLPEGNVLVSVRGLYDGCYIAKLPDGSYVNLLKKDDWRYRKIQDYLENVLLKDSK